MSVWIRLTQCVSWQRREGARGARIHGLLAILIVAAFLRAYELPHFPPGLYPDEAMNGNNALHALRTGEFRLFYVENNGREGLFINIQALFLWLFGPQPWALRLVSVLFGLAAVGAICMLGAELFSWRIGLVASFFLATSLWHIILSRIGFRAISAPFFLMLGLALFLRALRAPSRETSTWCAVLAGAVIGLGFHTYIAYRIMPLLFGVFLLRRVRDACVWRIMPAFALGILVTALPIGWYYLQNPHDFFGRSAQVSVFRSERPYSELWTNVRRTAGMLIVAGDRNPRHNIPREPQLYWPIGVLFVIGVAMGARGFHQRRPQTVGNDALPDVPARALLFSWLGLAAVPAVMTSEGVPHALRSILMIPPVFLFAALGGAWMYDFFRGRIRERVLQGGLLIGAIWLVDRAFESYFFRYARDPQTAQAFNLDYVEIARALNGLPATMPKFVIVEAGGVDVKGVPMPAQTVMFLTDTWNEDQQREKGIFYVTGGNAERLPLHGLRVYIR